MQGHCSQLHPACEEKYTIHMIVAAASPCTVTPQTMHSIRKWNTILLAENLMRSYQHDKKILAHIPTSLHSVQKKL